MGTKPSRNHLAVMLFLAVGIGASPAAAETPPNQQGGTGQTQPAQEPPLGKLSWYGYQTLAADATAVALGLVVAQKKGDAGVVGAVGLYVLGPPTVHALHRRPLAAAGSLIMRLFLPMLGMTAGEVAANCDNSAPILNDEGCAFGPRLVGFAVGIGAAMIIDSAAIAWERNAPPAPNRSATPVAASPVGSLSLSPVPIRDGAGLVFSGLF